MLALLIQPFFLGELVACPKDDGTFFSPTQAIRGHSLLFPKKQSLTSYLLGSYRRGGVVVAIDGVHEVEMARMKTPRATGTYLPSFSHTFSFSPSFLLPLSVFIICLFVCFETPHCLFSIENTNKQIRSASIHPQGRREYKIPSKVTLFFPPILGQA